MSGVRVGTRLDRLLDLRRQVDVNIELERRTGSTRVAQVTTPALPRPESSPESLVRVPLAAVRPALVRDWARTNGVKTPEHGTLPREVVAAYVQAHQ